MSRMPKLYFAYGGLLLVSSLVAFLYFVLFGNSTTFIQWLAAVALGGIGAIFMGIASKSWY